eukprot:TRINITY_DN26762_c0_g1_i1.p1 TRINITY_DN26762_c0_g1~~TRINITY_DN26762_c0_g1_i1.p1  ORF type:complete len:209 (-),score=39.50 TRINITY_DN26762_c0_g1_i1:142-768(-)
MLRSLVGSEMCIRDRYGAAEVPTAVELKPIGGFHSSGGEKNTSVFERVRRWVSCGSSVLTVLLLALLVQRDSESQLVLAPSNQTSGFPSTLPPGPDLGHQLAMSARDALHGLVSTYDQQHQQQLNAAYQGMTSILWAAAGQGAHRVEFRFDRIPRVGSSACLGRKHGCRILSLDPRENWLWYGGGIAGEDCQQRPQVGYVIYLSLIHI